jgi:hypothetical protein
LAAIIASVLIILPTVLASVSDKKVSNPDAGGNILERFQKTRSARLSAEKEETSALVKEAKTFALYLNPPPKEPPPKPVGVQTPGVADIGRAPINSSGKFKLIATCVNQTSPQLSLALIDLPGSGLKWVRQTSKVDYLVIKEIKDGLLVVGDGQRTFSVPIEPKSPQVSLVKGKMLSQASVEFSTPQPFAVPGEAAAAPAITGNVAIPDRAAVIGTDQENANSGDTEPTLLSPEDEAFVQKFMNEIDSITNSADTNDAAKEENFRKADEIYEKYLAESQKAKAGGEQTAAPGDQGKKIEPAKPDTKDPNTTRRQPPRRRAVPPK